MDGKLRIADRELDSRLIIGTGKYRSSDHRLVFPELFTLKSGGDGW